MRYLRTLMIAALASAAPAAAQDSSDQKNSEEIVVEGRRDHDRQVERFVDALTPRPIEGQLSRFEWSVCPTAMGLSEPDNAAIAARMRKVAQAAAIPVGKAGCRPNVFVVVTADRPAFIERLRKAYPFYFEDLGTDEERRLRSPAPVVAWHVKGLLSADGLRMPKEPLGGYYVNEHTNAPSRLRPVTRPHFVASVVVVEAKALGGLTAMQLADYAAMRAFAQLDPTGLNKVAAPTILGVFDAPMGAAVPVTLTQWDLAYLRSLYGSDENRYAGQQRGEMKKLMREKLTEAQEKE
jgi:hypothetical protein